MDVRTVRKVGQQVDDRVFADGEKNECACASLSTCVYVCSVHSCMCLCVACMCIFMCMYRYKKYVCLSMYDT